jgi:FkbM family methyltransferase
VKVVRQAFPDGDDALMKRFTRYTGPGEPGFFRDALGRRTRTSFAKTFANLSGSVFGFPFTPLEWKGLLRSADTAATRYRMAELVAGWGPWMAAGALAARAKAIHDVRVYGVEADGRHVKFLKQNMADNGIPSDQYEIDTAFVGTEDGGEVRWPVAVKAEEDYGGRAMTETERAFYKNRFQGDETVRKVGINQLLRREERWDLLHIDIQGHEAEVCRAGYVEMKARVRWMVIGTHSRVIEGALIDLLYREGWILVYENPCHFTFNPDRPSLVSMTRADGTQVWRNTALSTVFNSP